MMFADRFPERFSVVAVRTSCFHTSHNKSDRASGDGEATVIECRHRNFKPFALFTEQVFLRYFYIVEKDFTCIPSANAELPFYRFRGESFPLSFDDKGGNTVMFFRIIRIRKDEKCIGNITERNPRFLSV